MIAHPPAKVLRKGRFFCTRVNWMFRALPVNVPTMFVLSPSDGNEPEYLVGMSPMASAATENVATTATDNRDLRIIVFSNPQPFVYTVTPINDNIREVAIICSPTTAAKANVCAAGRLHLPAS